MENQEKDNIDKLLLVFVHGFRGSDASFKDFPNRLQTVLTNTIKADVDAIVYPSYKTAGDLRVAVNNFSHWLCAQVSQLKEEIKRLNSKGNIMIVLLGHSMGGIVGAETILKFVESPHDLLGASIIGMLAYDTPFYSIHHGLVTDQAKYGIEKFQKVGQFCSLGASALMSTTATRAIESSKRTGSTKSWGLLAGAVGAVAVGAAAYMARDKISATLVDAYDEFTFIKDLTDMHGCDERYKKKDMGKLSMGLQHNRVKKLLQVKDIFFKCFYVMV
ncbi:hypothetical protein BCV71DRAFT_272745 [Rhizopus microsporus]|uniref:DUF676 domain-containing protein n=1 Tax=Rhizopus microsporus TaxID=58291 RepID=A0A1X0RV98_RHIZD|nr:hypothetical protein BCV71DRAFT_272745 [Rhizopus microsporus]